LDLIYGLNLLKLKIEHLYFSTHNHAFISSPFGYSPTKQKSAQDGCWKLKKKLTKKCLKLHASLFHFIQ